MIASVSLHENLCVLDPTNSKQFAGKKQLQDSQQGLTATCLSGDCPLRLGKVSVPTECKQLSPIGALLHLGNFIRWAPDWTSAVPCKSLTAFEVICLSCWLFFSCATSKLCHDLKGQSCKFSFLLILYSNYCKVCIVTLSSKQHSTSKPLITCYNSMHL